MEYDGFGGSGSYGTEAGPYNPGDIHNPCQVPCPVAKAKALAMQKQKWLDDYILNRGLSYFDDVCYCSSKCWYNQMRDDPFTMGVFWSVLLFTIGVKLCKEMDTWYIS